MAADYDLIISGSEYEAMQEQIRTLEAEVERLRQELTDERSGVAWDEQRKKDRAALDRVRALPHRDHYTEHGGLHGECVSVDDLVDALDGRES
jgi:hypothetical protein